MNYEYPTFDFSVPREHIKRMESITSPNALYRSEFMRDRDRVMYCGSFRRQAGKTQIYLAGKDDNQRNRLTHTLEVSQIARTISRALNLDCDLTEAIALGHDLGHAPFGHAGEQILHEIMVPDSNITISNSPFSKKEFLASDARKDSLFGFKHNVQSLRIAASIEDNYGPHGLNLTNYTLWGILHHSSLCYKPGKVHTLMLEPDYKDQYHACLTVNDSTSNEAWSFEAFVVEIADEIAQWHHDMEDAIRGKAMSVAEVCQAIKDNLGAIMSNEHSETLSLLSKQQRLDRKYITDLSRIVVDTLVNRVVECSYYNLNKLWDIYIGEDESKKSAFFLNNYNCDEIRNAIGFEKAGDTNEEVCGLKSDYPNIISEKIHHSLVVERMNAKGQYIIKKLFQAYFSHPQQLPDSAVIRYMVDVGKYINLESAEEDGMGAVRINLEKLLIDKSAYGIVEQIKLMRRICDHIAGMTDHYAIEEYNNLYG